MATSPKVPAWFHPDDPWLTARMLRVAQIRQGETEVGRAVLKAMAAYLAEAHRAILGPGAVLAAADDDQPVDLEGWPGRPLWQRLVAEFVMPVIRALFLLTFDEETPARNRPARHPEPDDPDGPGQPDTDDDTDDTEGEPREIPGARVVVDSRHYQRAYLDKVSDRLAIWPDGAFERVRTELQAGLALGQDQRALRDRVGRALSIDAPSRALAAQIDKLTETIEDPGTAPQIAREARARRAALYRRKDRADQLWWPSAARIARTEAVTALNGGTYAGAAANQERDGVQRWTQWWSTTDDRVRPSHWAAHMQVVKLGEKFKVGGHLLDHPGDPTAPAEEVVNCRCSTLTLHTAEEADKQRALWERFLPARTDRLGRQIDADGQVVAAHAQQGQPMRDVPGYEGSVGPFPGQYAEPHVYARDVGSGAGNCVCGAGPDDPLHTEIAPGVPVPGRHNEFVADTATKAAEAGEMTTEHHRADNGYPAAEVAAERRVARGRWFSPLSVLGGGGGTVPLPSDGVLRHRELPMALLWKQRVDHGNEDTDGADQIGVVPEARIEIINGEPWITGTAEIDLGNEMGIEVARRMAQGFLRWISIRTDIDPDAMPALAEGAAEADGELEVPYRDAWRLANVTILAQPEFDEATIELEGPMPDNGERPEDRDPADRIETTTTSNGWTSGMIALIPADPDALTVDGGDPAEQLHLTLAYLGKVTEWPEKYVQAVHRVAARVTGIAAANPDDEDMVPVSVLRPLTANVFSHALFNPNGDKGHDPATVYLFDGDADRSEIEFLAADIQTQLANALGTTDFPQQHKPFVPHVTAGYGVPVDALNFTGPVKFDRLRVALGDDITDYLLLEPADAVVAAVTGNPGLPFADRGRAWDGASARKRVAAWAKGDGGKIDPAKMAQAFLWRDNDADPATVTAYRFGVADIISGRLVLVPRGVFAAAAALQGARGGTTVPEADQARMRSKINAMYRRMREAWDDPTLTPPWEKSTTAGLARRRPGEHRSGDMMSKHTNAFAAWSSAVGLGVSESVVASLEAKRQSWAHRLADVANELYEPPAAWFQDPKLSKPTPLTITPDGRVFGHAHDWTTKHVGYADREVRALNDREDYRAFNLRPLRCADGVVVRAGSLVKGGHAPTDSNVTSYAAQAHYDDPAKRVARVTAGRDEHGTWVAGALVPGITPRDVLDLAECSLSGDWREVDFRDNSGKFVGISVVNSPGLPIIVPNDEDLGGYDDAAALVAAGAITRDQPAWAEDVQAQLPEMSKVAAEFGSRAGDAMWQRFLDHVTASGTAWMAPAPAPAPQKPSMTQQAETLAALAAAVDLPVPLLASGAGVDGRAVAAATLTQMATEIGAVPEPVTASGRSAMWHQVENRNRKARLSLLASVVGAPGELDRLASQVNGKVR